MSGVLKRLSRSISLAVYCLTAFKGNETRKSRNVEETLVKVLTRRAARFSKAPVNTGPDNIPGRLTGNFTVLRGTRLRFNFVMVLTVRNKAGK